MFPLEYAAFRKVVSIEPCFMLGLNPKQKDLRS